MSTMEDSSLWVFTWTNGMCRAMRLLEERVLNADRTNTASKNLKETILREVLEVKSTNAKELNGQYLFMENFEGFSL